LRGVAAKDASARPRTGAGDGPGPGGAGARGTVRRVVSAVVEDRLYVGVGLRQEGVDVRVLVGEDGLHDGVEGRVELLGVDHWLGGDPLVEDLRGAPRHPSGGD